MSNAEQAHK